MDFKNVVYNAARDGKLRRLKVFLEHRNQEEVLMLIGTKTNGATPLVMACRNGHFDVVEYLVDRCMADLEQPGSVVFDGETIEGAPPLWCAAAAGHFSVVKFLVRRGASVNSTTKTNSTPLRAACFDGHYEIVKFLVEQGADIEVSNRHGHTCLMIACYKGHYQIAQYLLGLGANVNRKSVKGNTALHDCAESGSLNILKMLIEHGAKMDVDSYGMTPLLAASVTGHSHIVEYLIQLPRIVSREESVDALELLGATFVDKKRDMIGALELWKRAMAIRFEDGAPPLPKPVQASTVEAYEHSREMRTGEELDSLLADPDEMRMQALLIRERILGPAHPDTSYYVRYRGAVYADAGKFSRCISLWSYALDMQQAMLEPLNPMTQSSLFSFTELFSFMMGEEGRSSGRGRRVPAVSFEDMLSVLKKAVAEVRAGLFLTPERELSHLHRVLVICLHLACLTVKLLGNLSKSEWDQALKVLYQLVSLNPRGKGGQTPLHLACSEEAALVGRYPACRFPSPGLVSALLKTGADPNALDDSGSSPLHVAARSRPVSTPLIKSLLDAGAHYDAKDATGRIFTSFLQGEQEVSKECNPLHYTSLACLAARTIRKHGIAFAGSIPRYRGAVYADAGKFSRRISQLSYVLDMQQAVLEPLNPMTQSSLFSFTELFSFMMGEEGRSSGRGRRVPAVSFEDMLSVLKKAVAEVRAGLFLTPERELSHLHRVLVICLHLACLTVKLLGNLSKSEWDQALKVLNQLVSLNPRGKGGQTPLHLACSEEAALVGRYPACRFPSPGLVSALLKTGADPNALDDSGSSPLHVAARSRPVSTPLIKSLLDAGAHYDAKDATGRIFTSFLQGEQEVSKECNPLHYTSLACLAARTIRKHGIAFAGSIPRHLEPFVLQH